MTAYSNTLTLPSSPLKKWQSTLVQWATAVTTLALVTDRFCLGYWEDLGIGANVNKINANLFVLS